MWDNLPIVINRRVRQQGGFGLSSAKKADQGFDLFSVREFEVGDSPRLVNRPHLIKFDEAVVLEKYPDRSAVTAILIDISSSEHLGSRSTKFQANLDLLEGFGRACLFKCHRLIVIPFTDQIEFESGMINNSNTFESIVDEVREMIIRGKGTDPHDALDRAWDIASRQFDPVDLVCIMSDFLFPETYRGDLENLIGVADVVAFIARDKIEWEMPVIAGGMAMRDSETGKVIYASSIKPYDPTAQLDKMGVDSCVLDSRGTEEDYFQTLSDFFLARAADDRRR